MPNLYFCQPHAKNQGMLRAVLSVKECEKVVSKRPMTFFGDNFPNLCDERTGANDFAVLRFAAEEALANLENRSASARSQTAESAGAKSGTAYSRARRYARVRMKAPLAAAITGARTGAARIRVIALGGAFLETEQRLAIGDSLHLEFRAGLRKIESTAVVRNVTASGVGVEFVHLKPSDRERLRRLVAQQLE